MVYTLMYDNELLEDFDTWDRAEDALYNAIAEAEDSDEDPSGYHIKERYESEEAEYWAGRHSELL